jgi:hypothetical protein
MSRAGGTTDWLWIAGWVVASSVWCVTSAAQLSATFDEPLYIARGLERWRTGSYRGLIQKGTMPLPVDVCTASLALWEHWRGIEIDPVSDLGRVLPWARAGTLLFWWVLLIYGWRAGCQLAGVWGGRLAVALLACEPSLLAHASLATTDVALAACLLALVYEFRARRADHWTSRVGVPALWFAASVLAKASGLVYGALCLIVVEIERHWGTRTLEGQQLRSFRRDLMQIVGCGLAVVFLYCGSDWQVEASFVAWAHGLPATRGGRSMVWCAEHLRIFSNAGEALVRQVRHNLRGHSGGAYLLGQVRSSFWYYFPVALSIKLSASLLLLPVGLAVIRPRAMFNWAMAIALALLLFSLTSRVQIGIRFVLPVVVFAAVGLAAALVILHDESRSPGMQRTLVAVAGAAVLSAAASAVTSWPHGLSYANIFWGGSEHAYLLLSDSNYDWGQGLLELRRWQEQHADGVLDVWYFGADPAVDVAPLRNLPIHTSAIERVEDVVTLLRGRQVAASTTLLYGTTMNQAHAVAAEFLRARRPVARTTTFFIYDFTQDQH